METLKDLLDKWRTDERFLTHSEEQRLLGLLVRELEQCRSCEAVCHCGKTVSQHTQTDNHAAVAMTEPCPNELTIKSLRDDIAVLKSTLRRDENRIKQWEDRSLELTHSMARVAEERDKAVAQAYDSWEKYKECTTAYNLVCDHRDSLIIDLQTVTKSRDHYLGENTDLYNWRGRVTHALQPDIPGDISTGRAVELISGLTHAAKRDVCQVKQFYETNASPLVVRYGTCYSFFDHFDIHWDDGEHQMDVAELSVHGIYKVQDIGLNAAQGGEEE